MSFFLQGCWNYREIDSLVIVAGFAVDTGYEGHKYHLTVDLADTSDAGKDKPVVSTLIETEGDTIFEAVSNANRLVGMQLYWQNCQIGVIGHDVAQESILPIIDWLNRDSEPRPTIELFVSQESTAKEILQQQSATMSITSFEIDKLYELNETIQPTAEYHELYDIYNTLADKNKSLLLPALSLTNNMGEKDCKLNGMAVFKGDQLAAFLTPRDSKYVMFATDHIKGGALQVRAPTGNPIAVFEMFSNKTDVTPSVQNGKIRMKIQTHTEVAINELDTTENFMDKNRLGELQQMAQNQLSGEIAKTVQIAQQEFGYDIFGFCDVLHRDDPTTWYSVEQNWDEVFKTIEVEVSCDIRIRDSGESQAPVKK